MDDALGEAETASPGQRARVRQRLRALAASADRLVLGNAYLASLMEDARGEVLVLPTPVDTDRFRPASPKNPVPVLVWSGSASNLPSLGAIVPARRRRGARCDYRLRVVCDAPLAAAGLPVENRRWTPESEVDDVATADVNLMPLPDNAWTRGKCGYKLLLGMSCGMASVASPVGINRQIADGGRAALLATMEQEWVGALAGLLADAAFRARLGAAGRRRVVEEFSLDRCYPRLRDFLLGGARVPAGRAAGRASGSETVLTGAARRGSDSLSGRR